MPEPRHQALIERYEALRRECVARGRGEVRGAWGIGILLARGMAEWANTWARCMEIAPETERRVERQEESGRLPASVGCEEVVRVLAGMVWAIQKEATA